MSGATIGVLRYAKNIGLDTSSPLSSSMFTLRGNGLTARVCQPAAINNFELGLKKDNRETVILSTIRPLSHGVSLPQISWQQSKHRNQYAVPVSHSSSRNNSEILISHPDNPVIEVDHIRPSAFSNSRIVEQVGKNNCYSRLQQEKKIDNMRQPMESYTPAAVDYTQFLKVDATTLDFKSNSNCTTFASDQNHSLLPSRSTSRTQKKKRSKFHKNSGRKSRCKTRKVQKKGKLKMQLSNHQQDAMNSHGVTFSTHPVLQVKAVKKQKTSKEASEDSGQISRTNSNSNIKSFRLSSSQTSLCSEVFQRATTIYSNLKKCHDKEEKLRRVYLSEKQSGLIKDCGVMLPCAPPCTPTVDQLKKVEYVPSMNDIRSQRAVKDRLSQMESKAKRKELAKKEEAKRTEKQYLKDQELIKKQRQRLEIYALNKIMTELEEKHFQQFCRIMNK